jgi:hypothetical protein
MGFLSSIVKGVKNIFKGVAKVVKKVVKGVKKFASSKLGKGLMLAAAVYFGGAALGAWGGGGTAGTTLGTATELASSTIPTAAEIGTAATSGLTSTAGSTIASGIGDLAVTGATSPGLISQIASGAASAGKWIGANPELAIAGGQIASSMFTPSEAQTAEELERVRQNNSNIAGVNYDGSGTPMDLGLARRAQQAELQTPTYNTSYVPTGG